MRRVRHTDGGGVSEPAGAVSPNGYLRELLSATREELVRADNKASLLLAAAGVAIGVTVAGLISRDWSPHMLDNRVEWLWWLGAASVVYGLWCLGAAIYPVTARRGAPPAVVAYFGDVNAYADRPRAELVAALSRSARHEQDRWVDQLVQVSDIAKRKYHRLRHAMWALPAAAVLCTAGVIVNGVL
jgi:hypothetical protein